MYNPNHNLSCFLEKLYTSTTFDEAFDAYDQQTQSLGYEGAVYAFIPKLYLEAGTPIAPIFKISESRNPDFIKHYIESNFEKDDFTIQAITQGRSTILDWWEEEAKGILNEAQRNIIVTAKEDYGIHNGISIPIMNSPLGVAGASLVSSKKNGSFRMLMDNNCSTLQICTQAFHQHVMATPQFQHYFLSHLLGKLTATERRLLSFIASGKPLKAINLTPTISPKYADKLIHSIRKKFGNINKGQLIYYVGLLQLRGDL